VTRGRPRTVFGTFGEVHLRDIGERYRALTRYRDMDGRLRKVTAVARSKKRAEARLKERLLDRTGFGSGGVLSLASVHDLVELWLADLERRDSSVGTKDNYRDDLRLHVRPLFENYTLGEISTGRVEYFLKSERRICYSRAKHSRTVLNQLFTLAMRHDAMARNPVEGTSPLARPRNQVRAMTLEQVQVIRAAAAAWRTGPGVMGPKPDGQVRDAVEVLLGTSMGPGEVLALRPCDIFDGKKGMVAFIQGTMVSREDGGTFRQDHPKTGASVRQVPVPEFAGAVVRRRLTALSPEDRERTTFASALVS
jgi:integrase